MSASITAKQLSEGLRAVEEKFPISGTIRTKDGSEFSGSGSIKRAVDCFVLHITFPLTGEPPEYECGTYAQDDFWSFEGIIGIDLRIAIKHLAPWGTIYQSNGITTREFETQTVSLQSHELKALRTRTAATHLALSGKGEGELPFDFKHNSLSKTKIQPNFEKPEPSPSANGIWIHAFIPDFPLIHTNGRTEFHEINDFLGDSKRSTSDTFSGSFDETEFGLVRRDHDLNVYLLLPKLTDETIPIETHERFLTAFLTGLAFATGQHCWPYQVRIRQNGRILVNRLHFVRKLDRTPLAPFSERIGFNARVGSIEWHFSDFLGNATRFFDSATELSEAADEALWLLRSVGSKNIPGEIALMSLCVLLESLTSMIFDDRKLASAQNAVLFEEARGEILQWIEAKKASDNGGFQRFQNMVKNAKLDRPKDKFKAVSEHFDLKWDGLMKDAWTIWDKVRNKGAHNILKKEKHQMPDAHFTAVGRIAGAINILILRLIGYSGIARTSVFEDRHHKI